ncbi:hypothetical protein FQN57_004739 [Myotisia sp. PD_48]|nr:hypothetical protein FQN57_004739 [Myotisia sp. PD_48]
MEHYNVCQSSSLSFSLTIEGTNPNKYPAKQHARRIASQLKAQSGLIYLPGQLSQTLEDSDQEVQFRQRRYFFYLTGVEEPDCYALYDIDIDELTLFVPDFDLNRAIWMGPTLGREEAMNRYDVDGVRYVSKLDQALAKWMMEKGGGGSSLYILDRTQAPPKVNVPPGFRLPCDDVSLRAAMDACRTIKDEHEIDLIKRANEVSTLAHTAVLEEISQMKNEAEISGLFLDVCVSNGARNQAYSIIAGSGSNAAVLHYTKNNEPLKGRQMVCLDAGAEWNCYASDVTRTFPLTDCWPSVEAKEIYSIVQRMQEFCIYRVKEGARYFDLHVLAHKIAIEGLLELGILKGGTAEEIQKSGVSRVFFPHGLGHHLGLEVHDVSAQNIMGEAFRIEEDIEDVNSQLYSNQCRPPCRPSSPKLQAGMVLTVEPGIYFSQLALKHVRSTEMGKYIDRHVVKRYMAVGGVRIEDDILVTKTGYKNLTTAPKGEAMFEIIRRGKLSSNKVINN